MTIGTGQNECTENPARIYIQYKCSLSEEELQNNRDAIVVNIYLSVGVMLIIGFTYYLHKKYQVLYRNRLNKGLAIANKFTLQLDITDQMWEKAQVRYLSLEDHNFNSALYFF